MPQLIDKETGQAITVTSGEVAEYLDSGLYEAAGDARVEAELQPGMPVTLPASEVANRPGARTLTPEQVAAATEQASLEATYGDEDLRTFAEGAASGLTLGLSDLAQGAINAGDPLGNEGARARAELNPVARIGGEIVGSVAPAVLPGGALRYTPAGLAERAGARAAEGFASKGVGRAVGLGVEGYLVGAGTGVSELGLSDDPITLERIASVVPSRALLGGATGVGLGAGISLVEKGLVKGRRLVDKAGERLRARSSVPDDLAGRDKAGLKTAEEAEHARLAATRKTEQQAIASEVVAYDQTFREANPWLVAKGGEAKKVTQTSSALRRAADEPIGLAERPQKVLDPLRRQATALDDMLAKADETAVALAEEDAQVIAKLRKSLEAAEPGETLTLKGKAARRWADYSGKRVSKAAEVSLEDVAKLADAMDAGELAGARKKALDQLQGLRDANQRIQDRITALAEPPKSPRLDQIAAARALLDAPPSMGARMLAKAGTGYAMGAVTGLVGGGPVGAALGLIAPEVLDAAKKWVVGRLSRAAGKEADRTGSALGALLGLAEPARRAAVPLATRTLERVAYGPAGAEPETPAPRPRKHQRLVAAYRKRADELRAITAPGPDGKPRMTMPARQQVAANLSPLRAVAPIAADRVETVTARKVAFLASKLPRKPAYEAMQVGPDGWRPSDMLVRQFARYVAAVEDPGGVEERLADGRITKEDGEAYRAVYPERFADLQRQIAERLPELTKRLPYRRRLALSMFTGIAMDPAFDPRVLRVLQGAHEAEEGTAGGTQPAMAQAQFGSVSREALPAPTKAQRRGA